MRKHSIQVELEDMHADLSNMSFRIQAAATRAAENEWDFDDYRLGYESACQDVISRLERILSRFPEEEN